MASGNEQVLLTPTGLAKLQAELDDLVNVRRPAVLQRIRDAKALGDLRENFDFHDAKREQSFLEGRILALKETLARARVVTEDEMSGDQVSIGTTVELMNLETSARSTYTLVGAAEANPLKGFISNASPVGQALMGKAVDETVEIHTPRGAQKYRIAAIRRAETQ